MCIALNICKFLVPCTVRKSQQRKKIVTQFQPASTPIENTKIKFMSLPHFLHSKDELSERYINMFVRAITIQWRRKMLGLLGRIWGKHHVDSERRSHSCLSISAVLCKVIPFTLRFKSLVVLSFPKYSTIIYLPSFGCSECE